VLDEVCSVLNHEVALFLSSVMLGSLNEIQIQADHLSGKQEMSRKYLEFDRKSGNCWRNVSKKSHQGKLLIVCYLHVCGILILIVAWQ